ncbi:hypothetical protein [Isoptericola sp. AK164]|uniref:hypothetical protein n=1 Tax=Isoptericola sp. AK164 TaxID=3024246 RepID=UPI0024181758|nr:hypothetical protein [Isoptericola sp. AK164]
MLRTATTALLGAGAVTLVLTGCGADEGADVVDLAALSLRMDEAQAEQGSVHVETTFAGELAERTGMTESAQSGDVIVGEGLEDSAFAMSIGAVGTELEMILLEGTVYVDMSALSGGEVDWVAMSADEVAQDPTFAGTMDSMLAMDPAGQAEMMADAVTAFAHGGTEELDGRTVDVYTMTLDPTRLEAAAGAAPAAVDQMDDMTAEFRVTEDGLPLAVDTTVEIDGQELVTATTFSGWGEPVEIEAPPADRVTDYGELMG